MTYRIHTDIPDEPRREAYKKIYKTCTLDQRSKDKLMTLGSLMENTRGTPEERLSAVTENVRAVADGITSGPKIDKLAEEAERMTIELEPKIKQRRIARGMPESYIPDQRYW